MSRSKQKVTELAAPKEAKIMLFEAGSSGLKEMMGFVNEAYNTQLYWPAVAPLYARLRRSCPEIVMVRNSFTAWARNISLICDLPDEPTDDDKAYQEFIYQACDDMDGGLASFIDTLVNHAPFDGWAWWEVVPGIRSESWTAPDEGDTWKSEYNDGLIGIRRLAYRDSSTFFGWDMDEKKRVRGLKQQDFPNSPVTIPLENSLHVTYGDPNNPEGLSPLEAVWRLERIRHGLEVIQGIGFEHSAGYLDVKKTSTGALSDIDKTNVKIAARAVLTAQEGNYALWPNGIEGSIQDIPFSAATTLLDAIKHYSILMLGVYAMQWMGLNTMTSTGALASATDSSQMGVFTFNAMMDGFASQFDAQIGRRLYKWNRDRFPNLTKRPCLRFSQIDKSIPLTELGQFLTNFGSLFAMGEDDVKAIRKRSGILPVSLPVENLEKTPAQKAAQTQAMISAAKNVYNARKNLSELYSPDQPRDDDGKWTDDGGGGSDSSGGGNIEEGSKVKITSDDPKWNGKTGTVTSAGNGEWVMVSDSDRNWKMFKKENVEVLKKEVTKDKSDKTKNNSKTGKIDDLENMINDDPEQLYSFIQGKLGDDFNGSVGLRGLYDDEGMGKLKESNVWEDGNRTNGKLGGTSAIVLSGDYKYDSDSTIAGNIKKYANSVFSYGGGKRVGLVVGGLGSGGEDPGEIVIPDAKVVYIWK